jgi:hypothetical protein
MADSLVAIDKWMVADQGKAQRGLVEQGDMQIRSGKGGLGLGQG